MADINVERKRTNIWPWIIGLVVAALLIWALAEMFGGDEAAVDGGAATEDVGRLDGAAPSLAAGLRVS